MRFLEGPTETLHLHLGAGAINAELLYEYQTVAQLSACLDARRAADAARQGWRAGGLAGRRCCRAQVDGVEYSLLPDCFLP